MVLAFSSSTSVTPTVGVAAVSLRWSVEVFTGVEKRTLMVLPSVEEFIGGENRTLMGLVLPWGGAVTRSR